MPANFKETFNRILFNEATGGVIMLILAVVAMVLVNTSYHLDYNAWLNTKAGVVFGGFELVKPVLLWINDGLITIFFFYIGLELKHEFIEGHLSKPSNIVLPAIAAFGGILCPSIIFILFNTHDAYALRGWAIPTATDAAFAVALVLMLGKRVPDSLRIFLLSLAIFDDIGAIVIIALFYTSELSVLALSCAGIAIVLMLILNLCGYASRMLYYVLGLILWLSILKSGVHATLAGIITAFFIPMKKRDGTPLVTEIFDNIKHWVALVILPIFVFANAGVSLTNINFGSFFSSVSLGIFCGLFIGKQLGVFTFAYLTIRTGLAGMPKDATFRQLYGVSILTGIGFTMSMFIDGLAFTASHIFDYIDSLAIMLGSLASGVVGYIYLRFLAHRSGIMDLILNRSPRLRRVLLPAPPADKGV